jgi:sterol-4alpha-carboxylate 3-dehydrogenase (decarboxylating)
MFCEGDPTAAAFVKNAAAGKLKYNIGNGKNMFDFTYQANAIHAHLLLAEALLSSPKSPETAVGGQGFIITNDEPIAFWEFGRQLGDAAGFPTKRASVRSIPLFVGLVIALIVEWVVWVSSLGKKRSRMNRVAIRYSALTRTYRIDKAKKLLGYRPLVRLRDGIVRSGKFYSREGEKLK